MKIKAFLLMGCVLAQGCSQVDDYLLGKDNTPRPKDLAAVHDKITVTKNWSAAVGKSTKNQEYLRLKPVAQAGVIYTADASGLVHAVNKNNGKILWTTQLKTGLISGPTVANGYLALGSNHSTLVVLDSLTGKQLWEAKVSGEILSPPTIAHKKVFVKTIDGKVFAFNLADGKSIWTADHGSPSLVLKASSSPVVLGNLILIGFSDGKLDAFNMESGRLMWQRSIAYASGSSDVEKLVDIDADPIVENNIAYLASYQGYIGALSLNDGQFIWRKPGSVYKNMTLHGNYLYISDSHDVLWSIDKHNGKVNWKQKVFKARNLTEPVLVGNQLVIGDKVGYLHVLDAQTGEILARTQVASGINSSPSVVGKQLYVITDNGMLNQISVG